ncbi:MAG: Holliday junction resolvase RuvX [Anaerolineae bacterium]|nr:Holliday junction resolvase RuvX [Anaerolineae bacterium]
MGLDVGDKRIGIAISDPSGTVARPLCALERRSQQRDFDAIAALVAEHGVELVVVGHPLSLNGTEGAQARSISGYALALRERLSVPVLLWDERFSTTEAQEVLLQTRSRSQRFTARKSGELDAVAAAVILQHYLDSSRTIQSRPITEGGA